MEPILISIIIPAYNAADYISECIESIISQKTNSIEVIIINDGSTDDTEYICKKYENIDSRVKVISKKNMGVSSARNTGLKYSKGEWIMFIDADDWIDADTFRMTIDYLDSNTTDLVAFSLSDNMIPNAKSNKVFSISMTNGKTEMFGRCILSPLDWDSLFSDSSLCNLNLNGPVAKYYRKDIIKENNLLFNEDMIVAEDQDFNLQYLSCAKKITYIDNSYYYVRVRKTSASHSLNGLLYKNEKANEELIKRINSLDIFDDISIYWQAHLIEQLIILTRILDDNELKFRDYINEIRQIKKFAKNNKILDVLKKFPIKNISSRKKRFVVFFYRINMFYFVNFMYKIFRKKI